TFIRGLIFLSGRILHATPQCAAGQGARGLAAPYGWLSVDEHIIDAARNLMRIVERRLIPEGLRIKNDDVRKMIDAQVTPLRQVEDIGRQPRTTANCLRQ